MKAMEAMNVMEYFWRNGLGSFWKANRNLFLAITILICSTALYADEGTESNHALPIFWVIPFALMLLCIAILPLVNAHFWEKNLWWISLGVFALPMSIALVFFLGEEMRESALEKLLEYISFIILLASLFTISGGIHIQGSLRGTPRLNTIFMLIGSLIASFIGTTGASMLLIRPLIRANQERKNRAHIVVFFIFLVSNIGGVLTPLGDPPLFLGYLQGVPFEWTMQLFPEWITAAGIVLAIFYLVDRYLYRREGLHHFDTGDGFAHVREKLMKVIDGLDIKGFQEEQKISLKRLSELRSVALDAYDDIDQIGKGRGVTIEGIWNFMPLVGVIGIIYFHGFFLRRWPEVWPHFGPQELGMLAMMGISLFLTPMKSGPRLGNEFNFGPIKEVAFLFAGIFATMVPALYILKYRGGELGVTEPWQFFWATGILSSFLDNAPTYLTFLELGKTLPLPEGLVSGVGFISLADQGTIGTGVLRAISCGAVFMGANTYIGNGPNFMVRSIAEAQGVKMPSFFGYMAYSGAILIPVFILCTFIFFL